MKRKTPLLLIVLSLWTVAAGCMSSGAALPESRRFSDTLSRYPASREPLRVRKLAAAEASALRNRNPSPDVFIIVHPAYSLFFRDEKKSFYSEAKYALLLTQLEQEAGFIREATLEGKLVILIVPGNYESESVAPDSYTAYLNSVAGAGERAFFLYSESSSSGAISMHDMVELYTFLDKANAGKVLIGGGYIGRCQREFYNGLTGYYERTSVYIVPELSTISPDDISDEEAAVILEGIRHSDYLPVLKFMDRKLERQPQILSLPRDTQASL